MDTWESSGIWVTDSARCFLPVLRCIDSFTRPNDVRYAIVTVLKALHDDSR